MKNNKSDDDAYRKDWIHFYHPALNEVRYLEIFIPTDRASLAWAKGSVKAAEAAHRAAYETVEPKVDRLDTSDGDDPQPAAAKVETDRETYAERAQRQREEQQAKEIEDQRQTLIEQFNADRIAASSQPGSRYQVHDAQAPMVLLRSTRIREKEDNKAIFAELKRRGAFRSLAKVPEEKFEEIFESLLQSHPLFAEPIRYVRNALALCIQRGAPQHFAPILLSGLPGLGKTHFTKALAKALGMACHEMAMDANVKSSAFLGQDKGWSNSSTGVVYEAVVSGDCANPIILLDELEKTGPGGGNYQHPLASLHTLLEPVSSGSVTDISIGLQFDASLVNWIATCNHHMVLPSTLLSRFKVFHIAPATDPAVALQIARVMLQETHARIAPEGFAAPSKRLAPMLAHLSPREQRQALEDAYAGAVAAGRTALSDRDFPDLVDHSAAKSDELKYLH